MVSYIGIQSFLCFNAGYKKPFVTFGTYSDETPIDWLFAIFKIFVIVFKMSKKRKKKFNSFDCTGYCVLVEEKIFLFIIYWIQLFINFDVGENCHSSFLSWLNSVAYNEWTAHFILQLMIHKNYVINQIKLKSFSSVTTKLSISFTLTWNSQTGNLTS